LRKATPAQRDQADREFAQYAKRKPDLTLATDSYYANLILGPSDQVATDPDGGLTVVLHGEIYNTADNQADFVARKLVAHGFDWAKAIHGSFAIVAIDHRNDRITVITDRLNSRRIFSRRITSGAVISENLFDQASNSCAIDPAGVAWYLTNRIVCNSRTLFDDVCVLGRASIHDLTASGFASKTYWQYQLTSGSRWLRWSPLEAELHSLLIEAVRRRLYDSPSVYLALSAGYDATGLLGILAYRLGVSDVKCFSYEHGIPTANSDAHLSKRMAEQTGYSHETFETYDGQFVEHLSQNASTGLRRRLAWYIAELGAWQRIARHLGGVPRPVVFVGDECLGWRKVALSNFCDVFASLQIYGIQVLEPLLHLLPRESLIRLSEGLQGDLERLEELGRNHSDGDLHNAKDFLYLDQRLGNLILPMREACCPARVMTRSPLLDNEILDFMSKVPTAGRLDKRLYRRTITKMFPQLFAVPRSSRAGAYYLDLDHEFTTHEKRIQEWIRSERSRLDDLVPPDAILRLLETAVAGQGAISRRRTMARHSGRNRTVGRIVRRLRKAIPSRPAITRVSPADALMRIMVLRTALRQDD
jgi:hypothetical protein